MLMDSNPIRTALEVGLLFVCEPRPALCPAQQDVGQRHHAHGFQPHPDSVGGGAFICM